MSFDNLGLIPSLLKAVKEKGYEVPSPIQEKAIPLILKGKDILASAQTGTGKTAGFTLPLLQRLSSNPTNGKRNIRALILTPTRELAAQIYDNVLEYSTHLNLRSTVIFGGVNQRPQVATLRQGVDVLIATPGRLLDLVNQKVLFLSSVNILVLDEADRMLDMGFKRDLDKIMSIIPRQRQNLLFSATFSKEIKFLAREILNNPEIVEATPENTTVEAIVQKAYKVDKNKKAALVIKLILEGGWFQVLVFTRTKHGANNLCKKMIKSNIKAAAIHGNKSQSARTKALSGFKNGTVEVLVATDIAARGLDIPLLPHVINFELPNIPEDYVHRIGRTGRAGAKGEALSLVSSEENNYLRDIEKLIGNRIQISTVEGFEPDPNYVPTEKTQRSRVKHKSRNPNKGFPRRGSRR
ncbi:DEAD/DEAH box helicase [Flavobacteriaceae bacterium]|jgi:ATP-dependent RNA helicase RhlE|nr:DEAD/DEAH box helicase [Flavobacteriaceae bacterium]MDA9067588.1 DEAD/DEAH box helicase [Flavobacteriaceae bacterium]MDB4134811.1 DEAD/DEAH box helicase [Flavobacteriaceae bacterium]MDC1310744.1 DEAD/DEAH box helicase [Flavobacteriaceae bacterium]MDC1321191.1 DEAD/DEAH box helicase [Flavobacteriaceae bacterium]